MLPRKWMEAYLRFLLRHRWSVIALSTLMTLILGNYLSQTKIQMNFRDIIPPNHPYTILARKHERMFGSANILVVAVEVKDGDIFTVATLNKIDRITRDLLETPGVNPWQILSIAHPKVRNIQISASGIRALPLYFPGPPKEQADVARIKKSIYTNDGILDFFVSRDGKVALITAGFWESGLDFGRMKERLFQIRDRETDATHSIHMTGFPMLFCWIFSYEAQIFLHYGPDRLVHYGPALVLFPHCAGGPHSALLRRPQYPVGTRICRPVRISHRPVDDCGVSPDYGASVVTFRAVDGTVPRGIFSPGR